MKLKNIFKKNKPIEEMGIINLTFKMPLISFIHHFKSHHSWEANFSEKELDEIEKSIKKAREGKSQNLVFEDELTAYLKDFEFYKSEYLKKLKGGKK